MKYIKYLIFTSNLILVLGSYGEIIKKVDNENWKFERIKIGNKTNLNNSIKWEIIDRNDYYLDNPIQWEFVPEN